MLVLKWLKEVPPKVYPSRTGNRVGTVQNMRKTSYTTIAGNIPYIASVDLLLKSCNTLEAFSFSNASVVVDRYCNNITSMVKK